MRVGQVDNLRPIGNRPENFPIQDQADCQSAAGYQPAPHELVAAFLDLDQATVKRSPTPNVCQPV